MSATDTSLSVRGADAATIYVSIATNFVRYDDLSGDEAARAERYLEAASWRSYAELLETHIADYRTYFDRVALELGTTGAADRPTDERIAAFDAARDPQLVALYFQFGRYLLIASSRPGTEPANLQGIWNKDMAPPWDSKYTLNINAEMNYWPVELTGLTEMHEPLIQMVKDLQSHDGAIHLLPALPDAWADGSMAGLRARGGFVVDSLVWKDGGVAGVTITSTLGGNARIRVRDELTGADGLVLRPAGGENPNVFYVTDDLPEPLVSSTAPVNRVGETSIREYDLQTEAGETYTLRRLLE